MSTFVVGQYWQSVKARGGSMCLSHLAAQRRDCEETDAVNALASLSVGVLSKERYNTHTLRDARDIVQLPSNVSFSALSSSIPDEPMEHDSDSI